MPARAAGVPAGASGVPAEAAGIPAGRPDPFRNCWSVGSGRGRGGRGWRCREVDGPASGSCAPLAGSDTEGAGRSHLGCGRCSPAPPAAPVPPSLPARGHGEPRAPVTRAVCWWKPCPAEAAGHAGPYTAARSPGAQVPSRQSVTLPPSGSPLGWPAPSCQHSPPVGLCLRLLVSVAEWDLSAEPSWWGIWNEGRVQ